jgi:HSP90 family molecular chaperone
MQLSRVLSRAFSGFSRRPATRLFSARPIALRYFSTTQPPQPQAERVIDIPKAAVKTNIEKQEFKTETQKLLEIVAKSLYMDKEVFVRELVSNASDALEKLRYYQVSGQATASQDLKITISLNEAEKTFTIMDTGVGMTRQEMVDNLGTIAKSGSKAFIEKLKKEGSSNTSLDSIIGQFGVGFYSTFIVGKEVKVVSKTLACPTPHLWVSDGSGNFEIAETDMDFQPCGTQIIVSLKDECLEFCKEQNIKTVLKKYSNFLNHPIFLNNTQVNTLSAIWARNKSEVTEDQYKDFFSYITNQKTPYRYVLHYSIDIPVTMKVLLFIPSSHSEGWGVGQEEMDISLYSRKVLIQGKSKDLLPHWLRFVKGVVDCEDLPLNISREMYQDSALVARIRDLLTTRVIKFLGEQAARNEDTYADWIQQFGHFIKEGMGADNQHSKEIAGLARYSWSLESGNLSLNKYIEKMKPNQRKIYYLFAGNREAAMSSPYLEPFLPKQVPVLFCYYHVDELIFRNMGDFQGYKFTNIETALDTNDKEFLEVAQYDKNIGIPEEDLVPFTNWVQTELTPLVKKVLVSTRLTDSPAIVTGDMTSAVRQVMRMMNKDSQMDSVVRDQTLEINPNHDIMRNLNKIRKTNPDLASQAIKQLLDNAMILANIFEEPTMMVKRINKMLSYTLQKEAGAPLLEAAPTKSERE